MNKGRKQPHLVVKATRKPAVPHTHIYTHAHTRTHMHKHAHACAPACTHNYSPCVCWCKIQWIYFVSLLLKLMPTLGCAPTMLTWTPADAQKDDAQDRTSRNELSFSTPSKMGKWPQKGLRRSDWTYFLHGCVEQTFYLKLPLSKPSVSCNITGDNKHRHQKRAYTDACKQEPPSRPSVAVPFGEHTTWA